MSDSNGVGFVPLEKSGLLRLCEQAKEGAEIRIAHAKATAIKEHREKLVRRSKGVFARLLRWLDAFLRAWFDMSPPMPTFPLSDEAVWSMACDEARNFYGTPHDYFWANYYIKESLEKIESLRKSCSSSLVRTILVRLTHHDSALHWQKNGPASVGALPDPDQSTGGTSHE